MEQETAVLGQDVFLDQLRHSEKGFQKESLFYILFSSMEKL